MHNKANNIIDIENDLEEVKDSFQAIAMLTINADFEASKLTALIQVVTNRLEVVINELEELRRPRNAT